MTYYNENKFIFTKEAYNAYMELNEVFKGKFWRFFETQNFINDGDCIFYFMVKLFATKKNYKLNTKLNFTDIILQKIISQYHKKEQIDTKNVFRKKTYVVFKHKKFFVKYDSEYAEHIFSKFEMHCWNEKKISDDKNRILLFGEEWWQTYSNIMN